jgi:hypothetical protein
MDHPNIVRIYDLGVADDHAHIVIILAVVI